MKILIDKRTIKLNPDAGKTSFIQKGPTTFSFEFFGELPEWLKDGIDGCAIASITCDSNRPPIIKGFFTHESKTFKRIAATKGGSTQIRSAAERIDFLTAIPKYSYKYQNPLIKCLTCNKSTRLKDIKEGEYETDDFFDTYLICNYCNEHDSFEPIEYQKIDEIKK